MPPLLEISSLKKSFMQGGNVLEVLRGIDLKVTKGERLGLVGPSGAGKSTLLHILGTLDRPTTGSVKFEDDDVFNRNDHELALFRNKRIGFVFQFHHLLPEFDALENVSMPLRIRGSLPEEANDRAFELLKSVGLEERLTHRPSQLSGGEQQRVALARALACAPDIILADEPTGNLDAQTSKNVHQLLVKLNQEMGVTLIVATHSEELANKMDRLITLSDGKITEEKRN
jgi:lipoprotein-releasing system ATP-binding protein